MDMKHVIIANQKRHMKFGYILTEVTIWVRLGYNLINLMD